MIGKRLMQDRAFIDTNILVYSYSEDELEKRASVNRLFRNYASNLIISTQVINEFTNVLYKKFKLKSVDIENVVLEIDSLLPIVNFDLTTQIKAMHIKDKYRLQFYDSLIIATALEHQCSILFSEDMQHRQVIDGTLTVINPFRD